MKLYRAACSLSDVDSQFFPSQKNSCPWFRTKSVPLHKNVWVGMLGYQRKKRNRKFKVIWSECSIKYYLCCCLKFSVQTEVSKWNLAKDKANEIVLTWKRRPHVCLSLSNQMCGRTADVQYHNCPSLCSLCEGKVGAKTVYISLVFMNYSN